jgi:hypothetical protein
MRATIRGTSTRWRRDGAFLYRKCAGHGAQAAPDGKAGSKGLTKDQARFKSSRFGAELGVRRLE